MVLYAYSYNGVAIRTPGGGIAGSVDCCCDAVVVPDDCCPFDVANEFCTLHATCQFTGDILAKLTSLAGCPDPMEACLEYIGTADVNGDSCGGWYLGGWLAQRRCDVFCTEDDPDTRFAVFEWSAEIACCGTTRYARFTFTYTEIDSLDETTIDSGWMDVSTLDNYCCDGLGGIQFDYTANYEFPYCGGGTLTGTITWHIGNDPEVDCTP